jgi:nucleotide-binding universal stress UspA family protein
MFTHILVATDGSAHASAALEQAIDIARTQKARLTLACVWQSYWNWAGLPPAAPLDQDLLERFRSHAREVLQAAAARVPTSVPVDTRLLEGAPADAILRELDRGDYDLVAMGSRGRGDMGSLLLGSVSHHVLHRGRVPTLIIRRPEEAKPS